MSSRKRSLRSLRSRNQRRSLPPLLENLEPRLVLSQVGVNPLQPIIGPVAPVLSGSPTLSSPTTTSQSTVGSVANSPTGSGPIAIAPGATPPSNVPPASSTLPKPGYIIFQPPGAGPDGGVSPFQSSKAVGYTPQQIKTAYGVNLISFGSVIGDGKGQTIAVVDAFDNPGFVNSTDPNFKTSALAVFDKTFKLPDPPSFTKYNQTGGTTPLPPGNGNWGPEIALDVEWAHAIAPEANIDLVEATTNTFTDLMQAAYTAGAGVNAPLPGGPGLGASVVSMSFGADLESRGLGSFETASDAKYLEPAMASNNVTFLASTGDSGAAPGAAPNYPSVSKDVVAVGGTTLPLNKQGNYPGTALPKGETGWSGGGGGISNTYVTPPYQQNDGFNSGGFRTVPDVSSDADPATGVAVFDPYDFGANTGWIQVGGTSVSSPCWAGFIAIANQGRALDGYSPLVGSTQTLPALYSVPSTDFHDILYGNNFYSAGPGYDLVTGIGTPVANNLIPDLVDYAQAVNLSITVQPPSSVIAGGIFGTLATAATADGRPAVAFKDTATMSLVSGPVGASFIPVVLPFVRGQAVLDGLSLSQLSNGTPYIFKVTVTSGNTVVDTLTTDPVFVTTPATSGVGVYYPLPIDSSFRNEIGLAGSNSDPTNDFNLVYTQGYNLTNGQLLIENTTSLANKTISIAGQGQATSIITANQSGRVFEIIGSSGPSSNLTVLFQNLAIEGGLATDAGGLSLPTGTAVGGGLLIDGGLVSLSNVAVQSNEAKGGQGQKGAVGASVTAGPGGPGGPGANAMGGAIYLAAGSLTLKNDAIAGNIAKGGSGGTGGTGGLAGTLTPSGFFFFAQPIPGGLGGTGGVGGTGQGGGLFVNGGNVSITSGTMTSNNAVGGDGGKGGTGGFGGAAFGGVGRITFYPGGKGGLGGVGGLGEGGGIYLSAGSVTLNSAQIAANTAVGGVGGPGGTGAHGVYVFSSSASTTIQGPGGSGGDGGKAGNASGGGLYVVNGTISWNSASLDFNSAQGGAGGPGGPGGTGSTTGASGTGGPGGSGSGGGIFDVASLTLTGATVSNNQANVGGGIDIKGSLILNNSTLTSNSASAGGGGIEITGNLTINQSTLTDNTATNNGGAIESSGTFTVNGGTFSGNTAGVWGGGIFSNNTGTISGAEFDNNSAQDGGAIFSYQNGTLTVENGADFTSNSARNGGAIASLGTLTVSDSTFSSNSAIGGSDDGGGIFNDQGKATVTNTTFIGNSALVGGAIESFKGTLTVTGGTLSNNTAPSGFGGAIESSGKLTVSGVTIDGNSAPNGRGGGIYNDQGTLTVTNGAQILNNSAFRGGGIFNYGKLSLADSTMASNSASSSSSSAYGGGLYNRSGAVSIAGSTIKNNLAGSGGGIYLNNGVLTITDSTVSGNAANAANGSGGGILNNLGQLTINQDTITSNHAALQGGGISNDGGLTITVVPFSQNTALLGGGLFNDSAGVATVLDATFDQNQATSGGGAIDNVGKLSFTNTTVANNSAQLGGGIYNKAGTLTAVNATIAENNALLAGHGGGIDVNGGSVTLYNTIIASNTRGGTADDIYPQVVGTVSANSANNLIGTGGSGGLTNGTNGNLVGVSTSALHLGTLSDNGGPLATIPLLAGSPAIDGGRASIPGVTVPTIDERGAERGPGGLNAGLTVDIGAFEASSSYLVNTTVDTLGYGTLRSAVAWAAKSTNFNPENLAPNNPAPNTVNFDTSGLFSAPRTITLIGGTLDFSNTATGEAIVGTGVNNLTISGGGAVQVLQVDSGVTATLAGLTISGGLASTGGGVDNAGILTISQAAISGNTALQNGGAVANEPGATLTVINSSISGNKSASHAGGIENNGTLTVTNSSIESNSVTTGNAGGIANESSGTLAVTGSTISNNIASAVGGGIFNLGTLSVANSTLANNSASIGGGIDTEAGSTLTVTGSTLSGNSAGLNGGAIANLGMLTISDSSLVNNSANVGGGIDVFSGTANSTGTTIANNTAVYGGGISNGGTLTITNNTIATNSATYGGGIFQQLGSIIVVNSTIADNNAASGGAGGGMYGAAGSPELFNTIVALNTMGSGPVLVASDIAGTVDPSSSNNLVGTGGAGGLTAGTNNNLIGVSTPGLGSGLANNGGPMQTIALLKGSPAIDAGANSISGVAVPSLDQRGAIRGPAGLNAGQFVDIGAYEATSSYMVSTNTDSTSVGTLRTAVGWANASSNANPANITNPAANTVVFSTTGTISLTAGTLALSNTAGNSVAKAIEGPGASLLSVSGNGISGVFSVASGVTASITGLTITGGLAPNNGGGIDNAGKLTLTQITVSGNAATTGGGIDNEAAATLTVNLSNLANNVATSAGGGIANSGSLTLTDDTFSGNAATSGAGIANQAGGKLTVTESLLTGNIATAAGGGVDNSGTLTLTNSSIASNKAASGGGIDQESSGKLSLMNTTLTLNSAGSGGGIAAAGALTLVNVTIAGNNATGSGGGLAVTGGGSATLYNTLVAQNTESAGSPSSDIAISGGGSLSADSSYNLIGTGGSGGLINNANSNLVGVAAPGLDPNGLQWNGGPTQTVALVQGSPAIDAGGAAISGANIPNTDQRGALRGPAGLNAGTTVDIGAFEASSSYLVTTTAESADVGTIRTATGWANISTNANKANIAKPAPNTIVFDTAGVFSAPQTITLSGGTLLFSNTKTPEAIVGPATTGLTISGNNAAGVLKVASGVTASFTGLTISFGSAIDGGGLDNLGTATLNNDTFAGNKATFGGAIDNESGGTLAVINTTLSANSALQNGGGLDNSGQATITNTTIAVNSAGKGAGIYNGGKLTVVGGTIAYNDATGGSGTGGGLNAAGGTAALYNTIVALNTDGTGSSAPADDIAGTVTGSFNLIGTGGSGGLTNGVNNNLVGVANPGLASALANNGGPTQTISLSPSSPAINTGSAVIPLVTVPTTDQRGALRNPNRLNNGLTIDIGAYEVSSSYLVTTTADSNFAGSLRSAVGWANANPASTSSGPNAILFDPTVFGTPQTITLSQTLGTLDLSGTSTPVLIEGPGANLLTISGDGSVGVFFLAKNVTATLTGLTIYGGAATSGGGIDNEGGTLTLTNDALNSNGAVNYGGAVYNDGGTLTVANTTFSNDAAAFGLGGAIDNSGTLTVTDSTFTNGDAFEGGAIDNKGGSLTVTNSTFANNTAIHGGAIFNDAAATITGSTINNNNAYQGGGLANDLKGTMTLVNSTIADNYAGQNGGGINQVGTLSSINNTIAFNVVAAGGSGGGVDASSGTATFYNTIIARNAAGTAKNATPNDIAGNVSSVSANNLIGTGSGGLTNGTNGNLVGVANPLLGTLANNGGPTQTIALLTGSPAIGAGSSTIPGVTVPTTDQRGVARPSNAVDIGAYQTQSLVVPAVVTGGSKSTTAAISFSIPTVVASTVPPAQTVTKVVGSTSALPNGGSASKFHKAVKKAPSHHHASIAIKHFGARAKTKR